MEQQKSPRIIPVERLDLPELAPYTDLKAGRKNSDILIAESTTVAAAALAAGYEPVSLLTEPRHLEGQAAPLLPLCGDIPVFTAPPEVLEQLTGYHLARGVLAAFRRRPMAEPAALCAGARRIAVLEGIADPSNLGAVFRSALALGVDGILLDPTCCDPFYRKAARTSMGAVFRLPWSRAPMPDLLAALHEAGFDSLALALREDSVPLGSPSLQGHEKLAILLGNEGLGLRQATIDACTHTVLIPMHNGFDSLNVAAAAAIAFWELRADRT